MIVRCSWFVVRCWPTRLDLVVLAWICLYWIGPSNAGTQLKESERARGRYWRSVWDDRPGFPIANDSGSRLGRFENRPSVPNFFSRQIRERTQKRRKGQGRDPTIQLSQTRWGQTSAASGIRALSSAAVKQQRTGIMRPRSYLGHPVLKFQRADRAQPLPKPVKSFGEISVTVNDYSFILLSAREN